MGTGGRGRLRAASSTVRRSRAADVWEPSAVQQQQGFGGVAVNHGCVQNNAGEPVRACPPRVRLMGAERVSSQDAWSMHVEAGGSAQNELLCGVCHQRQGFPVQAEDVLHDRAAFVRGMPARSGKKRPIDVAQFCAHFFISHQHAHMHTLAGTVVTVNMLGVVLRVCGSYFYMCPCCTGIRIWMGDGNDLNENECTCWQFGGMRSTMIFRHISSTRAALDPPPPPSSACMMMFPSDVAPCCLVCKSKNTCSRASMVLPEVARKVMRRVNLCSKHAPPDHVLSTVTSYDELELSLEAFFRSHALVPGGGGRRRASSSLLSAKL